MAPLPRTFFDRPVLEVAPELLGCLVRSRSDAGDVVVRLTEVEAYDGSGHDPGSHAFRGRTARNAVMFGPPGHWYVYFTYGMHWCANIVCREEGWASAVLLRAGEVVEGAELAASRRPAARSARDLARGPARLASALGIDGTWGGLDATDPRGRLVLEPGPRVEAAVRGVDETTGEPLVRVGPRVGVGGAGADHPWRFWLDGDPSVSDYRPHAPRRRRASAADGRRSTGAGS